MIQLSAMAVEGVKAIAWDAPEYNHIDKGDDWYWALGIFAVCAAIAAFFFGNFLFAILILVGSGVVALQAYKKPRIIPYMVGTRGVRVGEHLYPYSILEAYFLEEEEWGTRLLLRAKSMYTPLIILPIPEEEVDEIENLVRERLEEEELEEPIGHKLLEILGF